MKKLLYGLIDSFERYTKRFTGNNNHDYILPWFYMTSLASNRLVESSSYSVTSYGTFMYLLANHNGESRLFKARVGRIFYFTDMGMNCFSVSIYETKAIWAMETIFTC